MNVICKGEVTHLGDTHVLQGEKLAADNQTWIVVEDAVVPANTILRAGSVVEKDDVSARMGIEGGWYAPAGAMLHTNLEALFSERVQFGKSETTLANVLRTHRIRSLEDIVANAEGKLPFTDGKKKTTAITAHEVLLKFLSEEELKRRLEQCRQVVGA